MPRHRPDTTCWSLEANGNSPQIIINAVTSRSPLDVEPMIDDPSTLVLVLCVDGSLAELDIQGGAVGFHALPRSRSHDSSS